MSKTYRRNKKGEEYQDKDRPKGSWWKKCLPREYGRYREKGSAPSLRVRHKEKDYADHTTD